MSQIFGGDFCKQTATARRIRSNVTRRSSAVRAGKHLTPDRRRLWELNPRHSCSSGPSTGPVPKKRKKETQLERLWPPPQRRQKKRDGKKIHYRVSSWDSIHLCMCECIRMKAWCAHTSVSEVWECSLPTGNVKMSHWLCPAHWDECRVTKVNNRNEKWKTLFLLLLIFRLKMFPDYWLIILKAFPLRGRGSRLSLDVFNGRKTQTPTSASGSIKSATKQKKEKTNKQSKKKMCAILSVITQRACSNWVFQYDIGTKKNSICKNQMNNRYTKEERKKQKHTETNHTKKIFFLSISLFNILLDSV